MFGEHQASSTSSHDAAPVEPIVVAGAGIIGASVALNLARRGARVTVVERHEPAAGTSARSFAWINSSYGRQPFSYYLFGRLAIDAWQHLDRDLAGATGVTWGGSLEWTDRPADVPLFRRNVAGHRAFGYPLHDIDRDRIVANEPHVTPGPVETGVHAPLEGHVDPVQAAQAMLDAAIIYGARVLHHTSVTGIHREDGALKGLTTSAGDLDACTLVIASGVDTVPLADLAGLDVPLVHSPGVLAFTEPLPPLVQHVLLAPRIHVKQQPDGRIVIGEAMEADRNPDASDAAGRRMIMAAANYLPDLRDATLDRVTLGQRPLPADGHPIIGRDQRAPGIYLAVTHSGVTLAPLIGQLAAIELLDGTPVDLLDPYRLARFS